MLIGALVALFHGLFFVVGAMGAFVFVLFIKG